MIDIDIVKYSKKYLKTLGLDLSKTIILAGAGVSCEMPTSLPLGGRLTEFYLEYTLGRECRDEIQNKWDKMNRLISEDFGLPFPFIRLEFVIGCIHEVDREFDKKEKVIQGISNFNMAEPNVDHIYLASLVNDYGAIIITPNFDACIEKAGANRDSVYHFHGAADSMDDKELDDLGATIVRVKRGLDKAFADRLKEYFSKGYNLICIGYSCSDFFDVTPFFDLLNDDTYGGYGIFFDHGENVQNDHVKKAKRMCSCFKKSAYVYGDTKEFLKDLSGHHEIAVSNNEGAKVNEHSWESGFPKKNPDPIIKDFYLIKLVRQMGIAINEKMVDSRDPYKFLEDLLLASNKMDVRTHIEKKFREDYNKSVLADLVIMSERMGLDDSKYSSLSEKIKGSKQNEHTIEEAKELSFEETIERIDKVSESGGIYDNTEVFAIMRHMRENIKSYREGAATVVYMGSLEKLLCAANKMLKQHFVLYRYISYYIDILRYKWVIDQIVNQNPPGQDEITEYFTISTEICAIDEIVEGYKYLSYAASIRFSQTKDKKALEESKYWDKRAQELDRISKE